MIKQGAIMVRTIGKVNSSHPIDRGGFDFALYLAARLWT
ncbi:hypothetical protein ES705_12384 [subsurface metagenome]